MYHLVDLQFDVEMAEKLSGQFSARQAQRKIWICPTEPVWLKIDHLTQNMTSRAQDEYAEQFVVFDLYST